VTVEEHDFVVRPVGHVESPIKDVAEAPRQGDEGGAEAWIRLTGATEAAAADLSAGDRVVVLTWLHRARRDVLAVHPRDELARPTTGVFSTRSQDRPNPIGLHEVEVVEVEPGHLLVRPLEAVDGTPVVDIKPVLTPVEAR
jgi:tRNA-Thr(GGU) m(6)t(6)A37 methyltransferase TsaA